MANTQNWYKWDLCKKISSHNEISCVWEYFIMNSFLIKIMSISIFKISKINFIRFEILLHLLHQLHQTQLRHRNLRCQLSFFAFLTAPGTAPTAPTTKLNWDIEIFGVSEFCFFWTAPELHLNFTKTKIVKFFSNQWIFFCFLFLTMN